MAESKHESLISKTRTSDENGALKVTIPLAARKVLLCHRGSEIKSIAKRNKVEFKIKRTLRNPWLLKNERDLESYKFDTLGLPGEYGTFFNDVDVFINGETASCKAAQEEIMKVVETVGNRHFFAAIELGYLGKYVIRQFSTVKSGYPQLHFEVTPSVIRIKGGKDMVLAAQQDLKGLKAEIEGRISKTQISIPSVIQNLLRANGVLDFSGRINENGVWIDLSEENHVSICGPHEEVKATKGCITAGAADYYCKQLNPTELFSGNQTHSRVVMLFLYFRLDQLARECDVCIIKPEIEALEDYLKDIAIQIGGTKENISNYVERITTLFRNITPETVHTIHNVNLHLTPHGMYPELMAADKENQVRHAILNGNLYLIDEALITGNSVNKDSLKNGLAAVERVVSEWRQHDTKWKRVVLDITPEERRFLIGPGGTTRNCLMELFDGVVGLVQLESSEDTKEYFIEGPTETVHKVKDAVDELLFEVAETGAYKFYETRITVPSRVVSGLIGCNRRFWREVKSMYCVDLRILDHGKGTRGRFTADKKAETTIVISGIKLHVELAKKCIMEKSDSLQNEKIARVKIDSSYHRRIAGADYLNRNMIEIECNVEIRFPRKCLKYPYPRNENEIVVQGKAGDVLKAEEKLLALYQLEEEGALEKEVEIPKCAREAVCEDLGQMLWDRSDQFVGGRVYGQDDFPCLGVDYSIKEREKSIIVALFGTKQAIEHGAKELEKLLHNFHVAEVGVPQKSHHFLDRYDNESRWFGIVSKAGGFMLPRKQAERLMQNPENGDIVRCCGSREIVEKVVEGIEALVKELQEGEEGS